MVAAKSERHRRHSEVGRREQRNQRHIQRSEQAAAAPSLRSTRTIACMTSTSFSSQDLNGRCHRTTGGHRVFNHHCLVAGPDRSNQPSAGAVSLRLLADAEAPAADVSATMAVATAIGSAPIVIPPTTVAVWVDHLENATGDQRGSSTVIGGLPTIQIPVDSIPELNR